MWINLIKIRSSAILRRFNHWAFLMLDRCQRLFFKNLFYEAACDSKSLNCNITMQKRFFWHLSQVLTNLLSFLLLHNSVISLFRHFFSFSLHHHHIFIGFLSPYFCYFASSASSSFLIVFLLLLVLILLFSVPLLLISIVFRPFSPHFYCLPSPCFCCFLSSSSFLLFCLLLLIHHFHIDHNASCPPPPLNLA